MSTSNMNAESEAARALLDMRSIVVMAPAVREENSEMTYKKKRKSVNPVIIKDKIPHGSFRTKSKTKKVKYRQTNQNRL
jgi:hypothetical protein